MLVRLFRHRSPLSLGFPILRPRFYMVGVLKEGLAASHEDCMVAARHATMMVQQACPQVAPFQKFLSWKPRGNLWSRLGRRKLGFKY